MRGLHTSQSMNYWCIALRLERGDRRRCSRQALLYIGSLQNDRVPRFLPESDLGIARLRQAGARHTIGDTIDPTVQEGILFEMGLVCRAVRCALCHRQITGLDIERYLEVVGEHILRVVELI